MVAKNVIQNFPENPEPDVTWISSKQFPHLVIVRAPSLLAMDYKIQEIVEELGVPNSTFRDWLNKGALHHRDRRGRLWVDGRDFADRIKTNDRKPKRGKLSVNEAFCRHCNRPVMFVRHPGSKHSQGE
jgi:hypothetical protein